MKKLISICISGLLFVVTASAQTGTFTFSSEQGNYKIVFPSAYSTDTTKSDTGITIKASTNEGQNTFMSSFTVHNLKLTGGKDLAHSSVNAFQKIVNGELISSKDWNVGSYTGELADIVIPDKGFSIKYGVIIIGQIQYQVVSIYLAGTEKGTEQANEFLSSFALLK